MRENLKYQIYVMDLLSIINKIKIQLTLRCSLDIICPKFF